MVSGRACRREPLLARRGGEVERFEAATAGPAHAPNGVASARRFVLDVEQNFREGAACSLDKSPGDPIGIADVRSFDLDDQHGVVRLM